MFSSELNDSAIASINYRRLFSFCLNFILFFLNNNRIYNKNFKRKMNYIEHEIRYYDIERYISPFISGYQLVCCPLISPDLVSWRAFLTIVYVFDPR